MAGLMTYIRLELQWNDDEGEKTCASTSPLSSTDVKLSGSKRENVWEKEYYEYGPQQTKKKCVSTFK